jgi:hypothetical protein
MIYARKIHVHRIRTKLICMQENIRGTSSRPNAHVPTETWQHFFWNALVFYTKLLTIKIDKVVILPVRLVELNRSPTRLIYMASLIAPLRRTHLVDQFSYLICPNQISYEKVMRFRCFYIFEPTHTVQIGLAYQSDWSKQIWSDLNFQR